MQSIIQIILAILLIIVIVIQAKGTGLGAAWGGGGASYHSKRGVEKTLFYATILLSLAFVVSSFFIAL